MKDGYGPYEAAKLCGVSYGTVRKWIDRGLLAGYLVPGVGKFRHRRVRRQDLLAFMVRHELPIPECLKKTVADDAAATQASAGPSGGETAAPPADAA